MIAESTTGSPHPEWQIDISYASHGKFKRFAKRHERENESLFANLEKIMVLLRSDNKIGSFQVGFFRSEGDGLYRIGQTGVPGAKESRLYVWPDQGRRIVYVLGIGIKETQQEDLSECKSALKLIRSRAHQK
jgi:hypothetical protein